MATPTTVRRSTGVDRQECQQNWCGPTNYLGRHSHAAIEVNLRRQRVARVFGAPPCGIGLDRSARPSKSGDRPLQCSGNQRTLLSDNARQVECWVSQKRQGRHLATVKEGFVAARPCMATAVDPRAAEKRPA